MLTKTKLVFFYFSPVLILLVNDLVRSYLRPVFGKSEYGIISIVLGWLPNFIAGFGFMVLGMVGYKLFLDLVKNGNYYKYIYLYMSIIALISAVGLILWEFDQKSGKLYFDVNDISATIGGVLSGYLLFIILMAKRFFKNKFLDLA